MAGIALSLLAAYAGPDRLVDCCVYDGRVFVACAGSTRALPSNMIVLGAERIGIGGDGWWTSDPDPRVYIDDRDVLWNWQWDQQTPRLSVLAGLGLVWRHVPTRYGYELVASDELGNGIYMLLMRQYVSPSNMASIWIGPEPPAEQGHALYEVDDVGWTPVVPTGMLSATSLLVSGGALWIAGRDGDGEGLLAAYDGTWFWQTSAPELLDLFEVDGVLHGVGGSGCYRWRHWALEQVDPSVGFAGVGFGAEPWWIGGDGATDWYTEGENAWAPGKRVILPDIARGICRYGGRTYLLADGALSWLDGARARTVVQWDGATLDNLTVYQNRLYALGEAAGEPRMLEFGGARSGWVDPGRWRITRVTPGARPVAIGTLPGGVGQVLLQTAWGVRLDDLASEWADGSGASGEGNSPRLDTIGTEWSKGPDHRPRLDSVAHEWGDGSGASPQLDAVETDWSDGSGDGRPELESMATEWQDMGGEGGGGVVMFDAIATEWADAIAGPGAGEYVRFVVDQFASAVTGVRLVLDEPLSDDWRALMRLDREALDVDAWDSYEVLPVNVSHVPEQTGSDLRVAIIGPWADDRLPTIRMQVRTDAS